MNNNIPELTFVSCVYWFKMSKEVKKTKENEMPRIQMKLYIVDEKLINRYKK